MRIVIRSFKDRNTRRFFEGHRVAAFQGFADQAVRRLTLLASAKSLGDLAALPSNRLESLRSDRAGQCSIRTNVQWRICFRWEADGIVAHRVHDVLVDPPTGISNVTEWAKKQGCWDRLSMLALELPPIIGDELISAEAQDDAARGARRDQRELNGIEAQIAVVNAGWRILVERP